jgi:hypothetical protein
MNEWMQFGAYSEGVEVGEAEDLELGHERLCVRARGAFCKESDDFLLDSDEWLHVGFLWFVSSPDGDVADEMWVDVAVVELDHGFCWEQFVGVSEALDGWLQLFDDVGDGLVMFQVFLDDDAEQLCLFVLLEDCFVDADLEWAWFDGVEDGVVGFCWVWDKVVGVEVVD